jgi:hypothetical protein
VVVLPLLLLSQGLFAAYVELTVLNLGALAISEKLQVAKIKAQLAFYF